MSAAGSLVVSDVYAGYDQLEVLHGISLEVQPGEIVALLGANGAGKTTTLRAIAGSIKVTGDIRLDGESVVGRTPERLVRAGMVMVPEGRGTFPNLTVEDNLRVGGLTRSKGEVASDMAKWLEVFPRLAERVSQSAGTLSGGEQQMLAVARAMMSRPSILLLDEPSMGLAPNITQQLFRDLQQINASDGVSMLVVEQNANLVLSIAHRAYVIESGSISVEGPAAELKSDDRIRRAYLQV